MRRASQRVFYAEDLIDAASSERLCIYSNNYTVTKCTGSQNTIPLSQAYRNERFYNSIVDTWSKKNLESLNVSGHDQFFSTFGRFGGATKNTSLLVAELRSRAAIDNIEYLELMTGVNTSSKASSLGNWSENLSHYYDDLIKGGLRELAKEASINLRETDAKSIEILHAGDPGRNVTVKYLCTVTKKLGPNGGLRAIWIIWRVYNRQGNKTKLRCVWDGNFHPSLPSDNFEKMHLLFSSQV